MPIPRDSYGKFFNGDAYIVYAATEYGGAGGPDTRVRTRIAHPSNNDSLKKGFFPSLFQVKAAQGGRIEQHIHFWLGEESTQDEAAVAAYKTVELDDFLGGAPIQHREVQGNESNRFIAYFKGGLRSVKLVFLVHILEQLMKIMTVRPSSGSL